MEIESLRRWPAAAIGLALTIAQAPALADVDCANITPIYDIQGTSHVSQYVGVEVETCGVVTAVAFNGYYLQDPAGDDNDATADGLFVFQFGNLPEAGDLLRVRDTVTEFIPGGPSTGNLSITQLSFPRVLSREPGHALPEPVIIGRSGRIPPNRIVISDDELPVNLQIEDEAAMNEFDPSEDGIDFYESLEGMLVTVEAPVAVSAIRQFGSFSAEVFVLANNGADIAPQDARTTRGGIELQPDPDNRGDQNPERVQIQFDGTLFGSTDYPSIKVGDRLGDVTGVMGYSFGNFEVNALGPVSITPSGIEPETIRGRALGRLSIATYNVLNLSAVPRDDAQRTVVGEHIARNLGAPDIVALQEIQDNNGDISDCSGDTAPCAGVLDASETLSALVDAVEAAGGPAYEFLTVDPLVETTDDNRDDPDTFGGISLGNIRNAFLYNRARVDLVSFAGLTRDELASRGVSVRTAFDRSRDPLLGVFEFRGEQVTVVNNHFSSRFGSTPVFGGPQPFVQAAEDARESQSLAMHELVVEIMGDDPGARVVVLGDLNTFEFTNDLDTILPGTGDNAVLQRLRNRDDNAYTFIFEGNSQNLDHVFVTRALAPGAQADVVHVNVDFPRLFTDVVGSDHEPIVTRLNVKGQGKGKR